MTITEDPTTIPIPDTIPEEWSEDDDDYEYQDPDPYPHK
jgi:hypothetical protein